MITLICKKRPLNFPKYIIRHDDVRYIIIQHPEHKDKEFPWMVRIKERYSSKRAIFLNFESLAACERHIISRVGDASTVEIKYEAHIMNPATGEVARVSVNDESHKCHCDMSDLMKTGCQCGGV